MRELAYIHGIGQEESAQRGAGVKPAAYIPYLQLTQGEMTLALLAEKARIVADYYDSKTYKKEAQMFENALYQGIHGSTPYMGVISNELMHAARAINYAGRLNKPASRFGISGRVGGIGKGIYIGADTPVIPQTVQEGKCKEWAADQLNKTMLKYVKDGKPKDYEWWDSASKGWDTAKYGPSAAEYFYRCVNKQEIEKILNEHIEKCGHHTLYGYLPGGSAFPATIVSKRLSERMGQEVLANVGEFDLGLMRNWLNVGVMRYNVKSAGIQPFGQMETNAIVAGLTDEGVKEWIGVIASMQKQRKFIPESQIVQELMVILRKYQQPAIAAAPVIAAGWAIAIKVIAACTAAIIAVSELVKELKDKKADAFSTVSGIGTKAFGPEEGDWDIPGGNSPDTASQSSNIVLPLLIGASIVAAASK